MIANRLSKIKPSPTISITSKAIELREAGKDVITLSAGEPDFPTPDNIKQAAIDAIHQNKTRYTSASGTIELKQAIADKLSRENSLTYQTNEIIAGTGGKQVLFNLFLATINELDEVIIPAPYWVSYPDMVALAGGTPVFAICGEEEGFKLTPSKLEEAITPKTKWLILNSPSNPTGAVYSKEELQSLSKVLKQHPHVHIVSDDIYEHLIYDEASFYNISMISPDLQPRTFIVNGVSKSYAMTGWRLGYGAGNSDIIKAMVTLQSQSTSNPCSISQAAAVAALTGSQDFIAKSKDVFEKRRNMLLERLNAIDGINCYKSGGAFYLYPNIKGVLGKKTPSGSIINNTTDFVSYLLEDALVAAVPGVAFGLDPYFRISYALSEDELENACDRIQKSCKKLI